jgi:hypothetical protein
LRFGPAAEQFYLAAAAEHPDRRRDPALCYFAFCRHALGIPGQRDHSCARLCDDHGRAAGRRLGAGHSGKREEGTRDSSRLETECAHTFLGTSVFRDTPLPREGAQGLARKWLTRADLQIDFVMFDRPSQSLDKGLITAVGWTAGDWK